MNYDKHINIRISQEQLDWLDEMVDRDETHETCISTIIRDLIDKQIHQEDVYLNEYRKEQLEEQVRTRLVEDECQ
jgi:Arc/MetJ-type ribon-helix-helix transcriptional regulator